MAYNENLAELIRRYMTEKNVSFTEKKMFGGVAIMVDDKMCVGVMNDSLIARIGPDVEDELLKDGVERMAFKNGRTMKNFLMIGPPASDHDCTLDYYIQRSLDFNPHAKASKKSTRKKS